MTNVILVLMHTYIMKVMYGMHILPRHSHSNPEGKIMDKFGTSICDIGYFGTEHKSIGSDSSTKIDTLGYSNHRVSNSCSNSFLRIMTNTIKLSFTKRGYIKHSVCRCIVHNFTNPHKEKPYVNYDRPPSQLFNTRVYAR